MAEVSQLRKFFGYFFFAGIGAIADVLVFFALLLASVSLPASAACSTATGAILSYVLNSKFVFGAKPEFSTFARFVTVGLVSSALAVLVVPNLSQLLGSIELGKLGWMAIQAALQFVVHRFWTFRFGK